MSEPCPETGHFRKCLYDCGATVLLCPDQLLHSLCTYTLAHILHNSPTAGKTLGLFYLHLVKAAKIIIHILYLMKHNHIHMTMTLLICCIESRFGRSHH